MKRIEITYVSDTVVMEWDGAEASAPICVDGLPTQYQTADARHRTQEAVRLVCRLMWGDIYATAKEAVAAGLDPRGSNVCVWDEVEYAAAAE